MKKEYFYMYMNNNGCYRIEKRLSGYYISYTNYDHDVYYTVYGKYEKLGNASNKLWNIAKNDHDNNEICKHYFSVYELLPDKLKSEYGF